MKINSKISGVTFVILLSGCGGTTNSDRVDQIIANSKKIAGCLNQSYQQPTQARLDAIAKDCTADELNSLNTYLACVVKPECDTSLSTADRIKASEACGNEPKPSQKCKDARSAP